MHTYTHTYYIHSYIHNKTWKYFRTLFELHIYSNITRPFCWCFSFISSKMYKKCPTSLMPRNQLFSNRQTAVIWYHASSCLYIYCIYSTPYPWLEVNFNYGMLLHCTYYKRIVWYHICRYTSNATQFWLLEKSGQKWLYPVLYELRASVCCVLERDNAKVEKTVSTAWWNC